MSSSMAAPVAVEYPDSDGKPMAEALVAELEARLRRHG